MKKIILILASVPLIVTSCMKGTNYEGSFYFTDTGIYNNSSEIFKDGATVYLFPAPSDGSRESVFAVGNTLAYFSCSTSSSLMGGFALSKQEWEKPETGSEEGDDTEGGTADESSATITETPGEYCVYGKSKESSKTPSAPFFYFRQTNIMPEHDMLFIPFESGTCTLIGMYVCNSASTVRAIRGENVDENVFNLNGDYTLTATGYLDGKVTGTATFLLAGKGKSKVTEGGVVKDSLVTEWSAFDLSKLGSVDYIDFDLALSDPADNLPYTDFCMDNFTAQIHISY